MNSENPGQELSEQKNIEPGPMGLDGYWTLLLSNILLLCSGGLYWAWLVDYVHKKSRQTDCHVDNCDYIAVLGMRLSDDEIQPAYEQRLQRAQQLFDEKTASQILIVGGLVGANQVTEAQSGKNYLLERGVPAEHILTEDRSRHTLENLHNARSSYLEGGNKSIALISNRFHLARVHVIANGLGITHQLCAAEDRFEVNGKLILLQLLEAYYIHWYKVGSFWSQLMRNKKSLSRIR